jgi:uncharacterized protein YbcI
MTGLAVQAREATRAVSGANRRDTLLGSARSNVGQGLTQRADLGRGGAERLALRWSRVEPERGEMSEISEHLASPLTAASNAMVRLHKEQFGRGPTNARAHFAGPDTLVCVLEDVLLPAEHKLVKMGEHQRVRETRIAYQVATAQNFVAAIEQIFHRKVRAFSSGTDVTEDVVFETFLFERNGDGRDDDGLPSTDR